MRLQGFAILLSCVALAACQSVSLAPPDASPARQASITGSHLDPGDGRMDTFRLTHVDGWPVNTQNTTEPQKTWGVDQVNTIVAGRSVRIDIEGLVRYGNPFRTMFWDPKLVEGHVDFVPVADAHYVVRGEIGPTGSSVWLEDERTHEVVVRKFAAAPRAPASAPDMRTTTP